MTMAKNILAWAETREGKFRSVAFEAVRAAADTAGRLGGQAVACVVGAGLTDAPGVLGAYGAEKVVNLGGEGLNVYSLEGYASAVAETAKSTGAAYVFLPASIVGKEMAGAVAAHLDAPLLADVVALEVEGDAVRARRPMFAGKAYAWVKAAAEPAVVSLRPKLFSAGEPGGGEAPVEEAAPPVDREHIRAVLEELLKSEGGAIDLTEADIIVSGGRGMKGPENYGMLEELAGLLGGAVGASRSAVDAGWRPHSNQVGQTGKTVSPTLYIAAGISGAIQHLAGMGSSKVIVAVNKDPEAPICKVADYCIVGDLFKVVPVMIEEVKKLQSS
jgi:electron transfer flavoprotein alpha subunit